MREMTLGNKYAFKKINIKVCGAERILVFPKSYGIAFDRVDTYEGASIPWATLSAFFIYYDRELSSYSCRSHDMSHI
jgi:hypothetical protein